MIWKGEREACQGFSQLIVIKVKNLFIIFIWSSTRLLTTLGICCNCREREKKFVIIMSVSLLLLPTYSVLRTLHWVITMRVFFCVGSKNTTWYEVMCGACNVMCEKYKKKYCAHKQQKEIGYVRAERMCMRFRCSSQLFWLTCQTIKHD